MVERLFGREAQVCGAGQKMVFELCQLTEAVLILRRLEGAGLYKGADSPACLDYACPLQLGVDLSHGIGVDSELDRQLSDGRELLANSQPAGSDRESNRPLELMVERGRVTDIDVQREAHCPSVLRQ